VRAGQPPFFHAVSKSEKKLDVGFAMPHTRLTGGVKALITQIEWLKSRGHTGASR